MKLNKLFENDDTFSNKEYSSDRTRKQLLKDRLAAITKELSFVSANATILCNHLKQKFNKRTGIRAEDDWEKWADSPECTEYRDSKILHKYNKLSAKQHNIKNTN